MGHGYQIVCRAVPGTATNEFACVLAERGNQLAANEQSSIVTYKTSTQAPETSRKTRHRHPPHRTTRLRYLETSDSGGPQLTGESNSLGNLTRIPDGWNDIGIACLSEKSHRDHGTQSMNGIVARVVKVMTWYIQLTAHVL